jgi:hypothetical protein
MLSVRDFKQMAHPPAILLALLTGRLTMAKTLIFALIIVFATIAYAKVSDSDYNIDFTVVRSGANEGSEYNGMVNVKMKVCWVHVSDGKTLYSAFLKKEGMFTHDCPILEPNSHVQGLIYKGGKYLGLLLAQGNGKKKGMTFTITERSNAQTTQ